MKNAITILLLCMIGGVALMGCSGTGRSIVEANHSNFIEENREEIERNVKQLFNQYHLDENALIIEKIGEPKKYPNGDYEFLIYIEYQGTPSFSDVLIGNPDTLTIVDQEEQLILNVFNRLYMEERYNEYKPVIDYLSEIGVTDPANLANAKMKYFRTSVGISNEINQNIRKTYKEVNGDQEKFRAYIKENRKTFDSLTSTIDITGFKENMSEEESAQLVEKVKALPPAIYNIGVGYQDFSTDKQAGVFEIITVE
ncbi:hypothetical protein OEV98_04410 [Caldibacillus lycopersici]|uniref:Uncharacterized protein n=1 Tax=Perspicuibacillus lycopersici TaxID=1325689 RepID=A0AAE3LLU6_9BACI|nr:hypothetical protein [Perspicuibacillus lycopersici]MCU9612790.1 hypothetical protein [Perspicuibacillus lycopersici]